MSDRSIRYYPETGKHVPTASATEFVTAQLELVEEALGDAERVTEHSERNLANAKRVEAMHREELAYWQRMRDTIEPKDDRSPAQRAKDAEAAAERGEDVDQ